MDCNLYIDPIIPYNGLDLLGDLLGLEHHLNLSIYRMSALVVAAEDPQKPAR